MPVLCLLLLAAAPQPLVRVAVTDVKVSGEAPPRLVATLDLAIADEARKLEGISVTSAAELRDLLQQERQRQLAGCDAESNCMAELASALGAHDLVSPELAFDGTAWTFTVRRQGTTPGAARHVFSKHFERKDGEEVLALVGPAFAEVFPERALKPGRARGVATEVARRLNPPPLPRWAFITTASVTAASALVAGAFTVAHLQSTQEYDAYAQRAVGTALPAGDLKALEQKDAANARGQAVMLAVTGGLLLACGLEAVFTDWHDDRGALHLTPSAGPGTLGATLSGNF